MGADLAVRRSVRVRYTLLQLPSWLFLAALVTALHLWLGVPVWVGLVLLALWVIKDLALYPLVRESYRPPERSAAERLVGGVGVATESLDPEGWVRLGPELWRARLVAGEEPVASGETVSVRAVDGLTLVVAREPAGDRT